MYRCEMRRAQYIGLHATDNSKHPVGQNPSHWVTSFRHWVKFMSPSCNVERCSEMYAKYFEHRPTSPSH